MNLISFLAIVYWCGVVVVWQGASLYKKIKSKEPITLTESTIHLIVGVVWPLVLLFAIVTLPLVAVVYLSVSLSNALLPYERNVDERK